MEKRITFRFYDVKRHSSRIPTFVNTLSKIAEIRKKSDRERELGSDFIIRLEEFENDGPSAVIGEIIRVQKTNMPSEVLDNGRSPLTTKNPLGHGITFRFNEQTSVLCIQYDPRISSPGKLLDYVKECFEGAHYDIKPKIKPEAWKKFNKSEIKKLSVKIAEPSQLGDLDVGHKSAISAFRDMSVAYDAPNIKIEMSMGHHGGFLSNKAKSFASSLFELFSNPKQGSCASLQGMRAITYIDDARDEIDLIEDRLKNTETLPLDDRDPKKNYKIKKNYIKKIMKEQGV